MPVDAVGSNAVSTETVSLLTYPGAIADFNAFMRHRLDVEEDSFEGPIVYLSRCDDWIPTVVSCLCGKEMHGGQRKHMVIFTTRC